MCARLAAVIVTAALPGISLSAVVFVPGKGIMSAPEMPLYVPVEPGSTGETPGPKSPFETSSSAKTNWLTHKTSSATGAVGLRPALPPSWREPRIITAAAMDS